MIKKTLILSLFFSLIICFNCFAKELYLEQDKAYILIFDDAILSFHTDEKNLYAEVIHTIFDDKKQMVISLKNKKDNILQIKTENNYYNYDIKASDFSSKELIEIDYPSLENLDVDIYTGV